MTSLVCLCSYIVSRLVHSTLLKQMYALHYCFTNHTGMTCFFIVIHDTWTELFSQSSSSLLILFMQPMDQSSLKNSDVLILTGLTQMPTANPDGMLGEFCSNLGKFEHNRKIQVKSLKCRFQESFDMEIQILSVNIFMCSLHKAERIAEN